MHGLSVLCRWELARTRRRLQAWHDITSLGQHTRSATSGVACHHRHWTLYTVERRQAWHAIIALGRQTRLDDVRREMPSPPVDSTHGRTLLVVALHHRPWTAHMVGRCRAWYDITALSQHTRSNDVGRGMPSSPLGSTHGQTTSGVA